MKILNVNLASVNFSSNVGQIEKADTVKLVMDLEDKDYTNSIIKILGKKSDKTFVEQLIDTSIVNNKLEIVLNKQFTTQQGIVKLELNIVQAGQEWTSKEFYFVVSNTINSNIIESITDVQTLKDLENYLIYSKKEIEQIKLELESVSYDKLLEIKRLLEVENSLAGTNITTLRELLVTTNTILDTLEATIRIANTSKNNLDTSIDTSERSKIALESVVGQANTIKAKLVENTTQANTSNIELVSSINTSRDSKKTLDTSISAASTSKTNLDNSISTASAKKRDLDTSIATATEKNTELANSNSLATQNIATITTKISEAGTANTNIQNSILEANTVKTQLDESIVNGDLQGIKDNIRLTQEEVEKARGTSLDLKEELDRRDSVMLDNIAEQYMPVEFVGSKKIENTYNGKALNAEVKGKTLQNLVEYRLTNRQIIKASSGTAKLTDDINLFKNSTKYSVIYTVNKTIDGLSEEITLNFGGGITGPDYKLRNSNTVGTHIETIELNGLNRNSKRRIALYYLNAEVGSTISDVMILEGDHTANPPTSYFEGIKSLGEEENKISILSTGKNLCDGIFELGGINAEGDITPRAESIRSSDFHSVCGNKRYIFSTNCIDLDSRSCGIYFFYDSNKKLIKFVQMLASNFSYITTPINCMYIKMRIDFNRVTTSIDLNKQYMLEEGTTTTAYEEYKADKKDILIPVSGGAKGLGNAYDKWFVNDGKIEQNIIKYTFDGTEIISIHIGQSGDEYNTNYFTTNALDKFLKVPYKQNEISNKFNRGPLWGNDRPNIMQIEGNSTISSAFRVRLLKSEYPTAESFKIKLKEWHDEGNPLIVYFQLGEPILHEVPPQNLATFKPITHLAQENSICGQVSCKVAVDVPATLSRLEQEKETLKDENIELNNRLIKQATHFTDADLDLTSNNLELDFRIMDIEFMLDMPINLVVKEVKNMSPYEMMKKLILAGRYEKEDMEYKITVYLQRGRITEAEAQELRDLMLANEILAK